MRSVVSESSYPGDRIFVESRLWTALGLSAEVVRALISVLAFGAPLLLTACFALRDFQGWHFLSL